MNYRFSTFLTLLSAFQVTMPLSVQIQKTAESDTQQKISVSFNLEQGETILKQTILASIDSPHVTITPLSFSKSASKEYLPEFQDSKEVISESFTATTIATVKSNNATDAKIHLTYLPLPQNKMEEKVISLSFKQSDQAAHTNTEHQEKTTKSHAPKVTSKSFISTLQDSLQDLVKTTNSTWTRFLLIFLLGLLFSLTPCIYPMIPITIGILHRHGKQSVMHNFFGSVCYAIGLSTTFAILGLLAAFAGASFGSMLSNPIFVIVLIALIGYMSLSMIGFFDLPTPKFLQGNTEVNGRFGPFVSAYLFGLLSGSIASPCVSPGLALILTIVATIGSLFAGFLLLFAFGIGMSVPLIIIGTFSSSAQMLPQAGQWMVEVKKALGFVMLATCFYYLSNILPVHMILWLLVAYLLFAALFYIIDAQKSFDDKTKTIKSLIGIILLACTVFVGFKSYNATFHIEKTSKQETGVTWIYDYQVGLKQAKEDNQMLLLDFWANHCTMCKAIDKKIFNKDLIATELASTVTFVKVDCTSSSNQQAQDLKQKYNVFGQPAILIVNPTNETVIKQWSSEPYNMSPKEFVNTVKNLKN